MKTVVLSLILAMVFVPLYCSAQIIEEQEEQERLIHAIRYQLKISDKTVEVTREIYDEFQNSFIDFIPALEKINVLINEYDKAMQLIPAPLPKEGEKLHSIIQKLLSRMESYFLHYKKAGRQDPKLNFQILKALAEYTKESRRLTYQY